MICNNIFPTRFLPNHMQTTLSNAPDFPKCGCKGTNKRVKNQIFLCFFE